MDALLRLEEKHDLLKNGLAESLQKKHVLELQISQQFEELKKLEISLEKCEHGQQLRRTEEQKTSRGYDPVLLTC
jgi:hypothetical protein